MCKQGVALTQPQTSLRNVEQSGHILPLISVKYGNRSRIIAGVESQYRHCSSSFFCWPRATEPRIPLTKEATSPSSYFFVSSTHSLMATPVGTSCI